MGTYQPSETFSAGTVHGASKVKIEPTSDNINITASSTFGPASVDIVSVFFINPNCHANSIHHVACR